MNQRECQKEIKQDQLYSSDDNMANDYDDEEWECFEVLKADHIGWWIWKEDLQL